MTLPPVYAVLDADVAQSRGWSLPDLARACLDGGIQLLQVRCKSWSSSDLLSVSTAIVTLAEPYGAAVIVNDRADVARLAGARGVHVGQDDLTPDEARRVVREGQVIGVSTHTREQIATAARSTADYLAVGPVYGTGTKDTGYAAVGLDLVALAASTGRPVVGIGGITLERAGDVIAAGASSVAVISDLLAHGDPRARAAAFVDRLSPKEGTI